MFSWVRNSALDTHSFIVFTRIIFYNIKFQNNPNSRNLLCCIMGEAINHMSFLRLWTWSLPFCQALQVYFILNTKGVFCHIYVTQSFVLGVQYPSTFYLGTQTYLTIHEKVWPCTKSALPDKEVNKFWGWRALSAHTWRGLQQGLGEPCQQFVWPSPLRCDCTSSANLQKGALSYQVKLYLQLKIKSPDIA